MDSERYDRQQRLREVGEPGQLAIERSRASLATGPGAELALLYLMRAGVGRVEMVRAPAPALEHSEHFRFSGPRAVANGASAALTHLRQVLGLA